MKSLLDPYVTYDIYSNFYFSVLGDDDSGCGESASSGDESAPSGELHHLMEDSNNLEEDYEKYMNEIRKERQTENKTNVPDVIAALMDEYGGTNYCFVYS